MAKSFKTLIEKMPSERRVKIDQMTQELLATMPLPELQRVIAALGGELEVVARFPQGNVTIDEFRQLKICPEKV